MMRLRSVLYTPGSNIRALEKSRSVLADGLILDLEDAVGPLFKEAARENVLLSVSSSSASSVPKAFKPSVVAVRINGLDTRWGREDLKAICRSDAHAVVVPKVDSPESVRYVAQLMDEFGAHNDMKIWAMIETPKGVLNAAPIAQSTTRLRALVMGTSDLSKVSAAFVVGLHSSVDALLWLTNGWRILLAARANGLTALDGVHLDLNDMSGFESVCREGKAFGFDGKTLIHPKTIETCNAIFSPSREEVERSKRIVELWNSTTSGLVVLDGQLIENLHVERAREILAFEQQ